MGWRCKTPLYTMFTMLPESTFPQCSMGWGVRVSLPSAPRLTMVKGQKKFSGAAHAACVRREFSTAAASTTASATSAGVRSSVRAA